MAFPARLIKVLEGYLLTTLDLTYGARCGRCLSSSCRPDLRSPSGQGDLKVLSDFLSFANVETSRNDTRSFWERYLEILFWVLVSFLFWIWK